MNKERFEVLASAYGGAISRWPVAERWAARWLLLRAFGSTREILRDARRLDHILKRSTNPELCNELRKSLFEGARRLIDTGEKARSWFAAMLVTGLGAACVAGVAVGFVIAPLTTADSLTSPMDPAEVAASALGNPIEPGEG